MNKKLLVCYTFWLLTGLSICLKTVLWARETLTPKHDIRRMYGTATDDH
jgi:prenyltransferase beta subunit